MIRPRNTKRPFFWFTQNFIQHCRGQLKCDGTRTETSLFFRRNGRVHLNRRGASIQSTTGSRGVRIRGSNAGYNMFRGSVKSTGYPFHSPVSPSLPLPCVTVCHHIYNGVYIETRLDLHSLSTSCPPLNKAISLVYIYSIYSYIQYTNTGITTRTRNKTQRKQGEK